MSSGEIKAFLRSLDFRYLNGVRDLTSFVSFYSEDCDMLELEQFVKHILATSKQCESCN